MNLDCQSMFFFALSQIKELREGHAFSKLKMEKNVDMRFFKIHKLKHKNPRNFFFGSTKKKWWLENQH